MFTRERLTRWTDALRARPEKQYTAGGLANEDFSKTCCLGELCEVEGLARDPERLGHYTRGGYSHGGYLNDRWPLTEDFGSPTGNFPGLEMPGLQHNGVVYISAARANDAGVPWPVIADHFDRFYPCSDTGPKERAE